MPMAQVIKPPVRKLMRRGERLEKSLAGEEENDVGGNVDVEVWP